MMHTYNLYDISSTPRSLARLWFVRVLYNDEVLSLSGLYDDADSSTTPENRVTGNRNCFRPLAVLRDRFASLSMTHEQYNAERGEQVKSPAHTAATGANINADDNVDSADIDIDIVR
jgi:hypothetical protein